jgi:hypothetical protein
MCGRYLGSCVGRTVCLHDTLVGMLGLHVTAASRGCNAAAAAAAAAVAADALRWC